nr:FAD-dependent oxidoreductase [Propionibacterium sp.]
MADVVVLGAGVAGHTAALHLKRLLGKEHTVTVVTPNSQWNWIPSNIWVGVGDMPAEKVLFPLADVYRKQKIEYLQAKAVAIHPDGSETDPRPFVDIEYTGQGRAGEPGTVHYDYLINATGPKLRFEATPGMGPGGYTHSVCTADHATHAAHALEASIAKMRAGERQTLVIGMGHGTCTCQGAAFEYVFNVDHTIRQAGVRDLATIVYLTNEAALGDFGVGGMVFDQEGFQTTSELWTKSLFRERGVLAIVGAHVERVEDGVIHYETLDGTKHSLAFDFSMLIPPFGGVGLKAYARDGGDITDTLFAPSGFMKVDADYTPKPYEQWKATDWPSTYEVPGYRNLFAVGIAFAPPHAISKPLKTPNGTAIAPAPPRTGMPSGVTGKAAAITIARRIKNPDAPAEPASMAHMGAACVASAGTGLTKGSAAAMTMLPVVPDYDRYPTGRDVRETRGELGLHGHWVKLMLHYLFLYKAKAKFGWPLIPE